MARTIVPRPIPPQYQQPGPFSSEWIVDENERELVDYLPEFHFRIWYNNDRGIYDFHYHSAMEIIVCLEGQWTLVANRKEYHLNVGDVLFVPPLMLHKLSFDTFGVRLIYLIDTDVLKVFRDFETLGPVFINPYLCTASQSPDIYSQVYKAFTQMSDIYFGKSTFTEIHVYSLFLKVLSLIGDSYFSKLARNEQDTSISKNAEYFEKFTALLHYIDTNCSQELTLEQAAGKIGFSKYHFSRLFKQYTNTSFYNYLSHKRIQKAQALLRTDTPITDIAFQTGFNNLTTFAVVSKRSSTAPQANTAPGCPPKMKQAGQSSPLCPACYYPFTPPSATPAMMYFDKSKYTTMRGSTVNASPR